MLVTTVDEVRIVNLRRTLRHKAGDDERGARAQVGGFHRRGVQLRDALNDRGVECSLTCDYDEEED